MQPFLILITLPFTMHASFLGAKLYLLVSKQYPKICMIIGVPLISVLIFMNKCLFVFYFPEVPS